MQKYPFQKMSTSVEIFILSNSSAKKVAVPKRICPKELPLHKKWFPGSRFIPEN